MTAGVATKDPELVLEGYHVEPPGIQIEGGPFVFFQLFIVDLQMNTARIFVLTIPVSHCHDRRLRALAGSCDCLLQVIRECSNSAATRKRITDERYATGATLVLMNCIRTLASHRWSSDGAEQTFVEQMLDSVTLDNDSFLAVLINPVGLRYHATHHLFDGTFAGATRVVDTSDPENSLILRKPTSSSETEGVANSSVLAHGGGVRFTKDSPEYAVILDWIKGAKE